ncbi:hypothetical protein pb186bvf_017274 [Paramecium bursaria]
MILKNTTMNFSKCYCDDGYYFDAQQHLCLGKLFKYLLKILKQIVILNVEPVMRPWRINAQLVILTDNQLNQKHARAWQGNMMMNTIQQMPKYCCQILIDCPENCLQCSNSNECKKCENNLTIQNGLCKCPKGFYKYDKQCLTCESKLGKYFIECNYKNCFDKIYTPSEECDDANLISYDGCTNCKIDNNYQCYNQVNKVSICYQCQNQCNNCKLYDGRIVCQNCNDGYFLSNNNCIEMQQKLQKLLIIQLMYRVPFDEYLECPVCSHGSYLYDQFIQHLQINQCVTKCGDGIKSLDEQCDDGNLNSADGCDYQCSIEESYVCQIDEDRSNCFPSSVPKLFINNLLKVTNDQYKIQIMSDQLVKFKRLGVLVNLQNHMEYNFTYDVNVSQNQQFYSQMEINITIVYYNNDYINFQFQQNSLYLKYKSMEIQKFQIISISRTIKVKNRIKLFSFSSSKTLLYYKPNKHKLHNFYQNQELVFSEASDSAQLIMKTQNYLQYLLFINIDYPPNLVFILNQFADSNILKYIDIPQFLLIVENEPLYYNKQQITTNFFVNIYLFAYTLIQSVLLIKLSQVVVNRVQQQIVCQILSKKTYDSKIIKLLSFIQYHLLMILISFFYKTICQFRNNGIRQIYFVAQYNIYFAIFIRLKTFQLSSYYTIVEIILTLLASIICGFYVFNQSKGQSAIIIFLRNFYTIITNIHPICFIFCILQQLLIIALQSLILVSLLLSNGKYKQNIQGINPAYYIEKYTKQILMIVQIILNILITFLSSVFIFITPFDVDYRFIQLVAILSTFIVNVFLQLTGLYLNLLSTIV